MLTTGCLHEDGLSDVADGFGGGKTRDRKLEIMRDSRIGAYGAIGAGSVAADPLERAFANSSCPRRCSSPSSPRTPPRAACCGAFMHLLPPARDRRPLGRRRHRLARNCHGIGAVLGAVALLLLGLGGAIVAVILLGLLFFAFRALCLNQIDGQTGDTVGALQQVAEIAILLVASVSIP